MSELPGRSGPSLPVQSVPVRVNSALADRFAVCKLVLHLQKAKIVYCKDANRRSDFPSQSFDFPGFHSEQGRTLWQGHIHTHGFLPAARPKALTSISQAIRRWAIHHHSDKSLQDLAKDVQSVHRTSKAGSTTRPVLSDAFAPDPQENRCLCHPMAHRKFKRLRHKTKGARDRWARLIRANPTLIDLAA